MIKQLLIMNLKYCPLRSDEECLYVSFLIKQLQLLNAFSLTHAKLVRCFFFVWGATACTAMFFECIIIAT